MNMIFYIRLYGCRLCEAHVSYLRRIRNSSSTVSTERPNAERTLSSCIRRCHVRYIGIDFTRKGAKRGHQCHNLTVLGDALDQA